jgi:phosphate transport system protein
MESKSPHIIREFDEAFNSLGNTVSVMAGQTRLNLERAVSGLMTRDLDLCRAVIADDDDVDEAERKIDAAGLDILVRFHPVATDLRKVISSMKVAAALERISDHAVNISKRAKKMLQKQEVPETQLIEPVYTIADGILKDAFLAYTDRNGSLGASLRERDLELDRAHKRVIGTLSERIEQGGDTTEAYLHLIFVVRSLERVGDLAVNIGEDAVFLDRAEDIRYARKRAAEIQDEDPDL